MGCAGFGPQVSWIRGDASEVASWRRPHRAAPEQQGSREERSETVLGLFCCINPFASLLSTQSKVGQIETI